MTHRILIVEDDDKSRRLLRDVLGFHQYQVTEATNGTQALSALLMAAENESSFDLVLMDVQLPDMTGFDVLRQLRATVTYATVPVAAVTASVVDYDRKRIRDAGFTAYIAKPLNIDQLLAEVQRLIVEHQNTQGKV